MTASQNAGSPAPDNYLAQQEIRDLENEKHLLPENPAVASLEALLTDLDFLPSSEDSQHIVWVSLRHVQETIDNRIKEARG